MPPNTYHQIPSHTNATFLSLSDSSLPFNASLLPFNASSLPFNAFSLLFNTYSLSFNHFPSPFRATGSPFSVSSPPFSASHCLLTPPCRLLTHLHWPVSLSFHALTPLHHPLMTSRRLIISLWWCLIIKTLLELDYPVKITPKQCIILAPICSILC